LDEEINGVLLANMGRMANSTFPSDISGLGLLDKFQDFGLSIYPKKSLNHFLGVEPLEGISNQRSENKIPASLFF
jgi:hypothetical protein